MSVNKAIVVGFVGKDPVIRDKVASFSVATSERWKDRDTGEKKERTDWHNVVCFNEGLTGVVSSYVKKGSRVYVEGQMRTRKYTDKQGIERYTTEIVLSAFGSKLVLCDKSDGSSRPPPAESEDAYRSPVTRSAAHDIDDEIPF